MTEEDRPFLHSPFWPCTAFCNFYKAIILSAMVPRFYDLEVSTSLARRSHQFRVKLAISLLSKFYAYVSFLILLAYGNLFQLHVLQQNLIFQSLNAMSIGIYCLLDYSSLVISLY